jgi:hypothetical protein
MDLEINIFKNTYDTDCTNVVKLKQVLYAIRNGKWKNVIQSLREEKDKRKKEDIKRNLPAVIWSGVFDERIDAGLVVYNQIIVIDIDKLPYKKVLWLKQKLTRNKHVLSCFESPSQGLKVLFLVDSDSYLHNKDAFFTIEKMFLDYYGVKIDPSGKNLARLCYVSWDETLYYNSKAEPLHIEEVVDRLEDFKLIVQQAKGFISVFDVTKIFEVCIKMTKASKTGNYRKGNRNKFIFTTSCLMSEFGVPETQTISLVMSKYTSLDYKEIRPTVMSAYRRTKHSFGTRNLSGKNNNQTSILD